MSGDSRPRGLLDLRIAVLALAAAVVFATLGWMSPKVFLGAQNLQSMLLQMSVVGMLALAVALTMLTGGIDLSINAVANLTAIIVATLLTRFVPPDVDGAAGVLVGLGAIAVGLAIGVACGLVNGVLVARLGYPPILATLGTMTLFAGFGTVITGGDTIFGVGALAFLGRGTLAGVPVPALVFFAAAIVLTVVLQGRRFGFHVYLIGANPAAARFSGIHTPGVLLRVYATSGALASVAGLMTLGMSNSANVDFGSSYVLLAILISVLGGIAPAGGAGRMPGVVLAVLILQFLSTGLNLVYQSSGSNFLKEFAWGGTLLIVLAIGDARFARLRGFLRRG